MAKMSDIPQGQLSRSAVVGATALKIGINRLQGGAMSTLGFGDAVGDLDARSAQQLFEAMIKLRGTAVKLAQMLGMESGLLPEGMQKELEKSWHQVPPLNRVLVRKVLVEELGQSPEKLFAKFDSKAFAAASLGQVHKAQLPDGTPVAVKIQYPGIHVAMQNDLKLLRKLAVGLPQRKLASLSVAEIEARLLEELDYDREAQSTEWFRRNIVTDEVTVPAVFTDFSTSRVLTTMLLDGEPLDAWLQNNPQQKVRDAAAQRIYDCFAHCVNDLKRLHADPNPGNYLFQNDGSIALIDFGCTRVLSDRFVSNLPVLLEAYKAQDKEQLRAAFAAFGMSYGDAFDAAYDEVLRPFGVWLTRPLEAEYFDFGRNPGFTSCARELIHAMSRIKGIDHIAEEFLFFDRTTYGLCKIFERLGATVRMRHHWDLK
jgi:predicted unusual protein kinase regulating ubiquinone biosynthesis (AarF/ABC1/UbiB family)